ncbi:MAG: hypothetical protein KAI47_07225, partial [Deltaproteobacteria bacterium]|nr:hypothetical protein [Deltaproteobacteria bacterium]
MTRTGRMMQRVMGLGLAMVLLSVGLTACGGDETVGAPGLQPGDDPCAGGKCDGVLSERFIDVFKDPSKVGAGDLTKVAADLITDQINDLISNVPFYQPKLAKTVLYALSERAEDSLTLHSLGDLTAGLTRALGEKSYATRINALRKGYLEEHPTHVWAEARFELPNDLSYGVTFDAFGSASANVRFGLAGLGRAIDATIIAPYDATKTKGLAKALVDAPARAVICALGGLPSRLADFRTMAPGQMIALHSSRGVGGFNINGST